MPKLRRLRQLPSIDRPREKLQRKGAASLSDFELLEVLIGNGNGVSDVSQIARQVQKALRHNGPQLSYESLVELPGMGSAHASRILSALELAKRHLIKDVEPLRTLKEVLARLDDIRGKQQEYLVALSFDGGQRLIAQRTVTVGTLDTVLAHPREIFADAIMDRAATVLVAHNHPSGDPGPSPNDITLTHQLAAAGQLLGVALRDHVIVTKTDYFSFQQHHLL